MRRDAGTSCTSNSGPEVYHLHRAFGSTGQPSFITPKSLAQRAQQTDLEYDTCNAIRLTVSHTARTIRPTDFCTLTP